MDDYDIETDEKPLTQPVVEQAPKPKQTNVSAPVKKTEKKLIEKPKE